ncbi:hypothetical protein [Streptomyces cucumeris]|uniref:hypothetical protein n=1 Tax=Streptomyces cucumeris TaxID=2962890 RepID=UPI0020C8AA0B|nr:hypothetical protein [Streptomyces sp. NEAU-Y11]MCP9210098.1 hypothetical protein [Streptomyces sp. NEAU-Y11]
MKKFAWAARGLAAASGVLLVGSLVAVPAVADDDPSVAATASAAPSGGEKCLSRERDVSSAVVDYSGSGLFETVFRSTTDRWGRAFLNDSRGPGVWINLNLVTGAPTCTEDTAVSVTEENPGLLFITLLGGDGVLYEAQCDTSSTTPLTPANIATACAPGFTAIPGTPV